MKKTPRLVSCRQRPVILFMLIFTALSTALFAADGPPSTDIALLKWQGDISAPQAVSVERIIDAHGYDNQPWFAGDNSGFYFTSMRDAKQTDIYFYNTKTGKESRVFASPESEYSPRLIPTGEIAVVRVEMDGTQRLWALDAKRNRARVLLPDIKPVGYQAWLNKNDVVLFVLGEPATLQMSSLTQPAARTLLNAPGRCIEAQADGALRYTVSMSPGKSFIAEWRNDHSRLLAQLKPDTEHFVSLDDGSLLVASDNIIYRITAAGKDQEPMQNWTVWLDLSSSGLHGISRLARSSDNHQLALVVTEPEELSKN
jgi:hypothetical protein